ncbi:choice-of-anchor E domain-containing protein [uncultured Thiodictyon sp.]|uniref:choice-of-anchor E domain-containing protein n=1 Tax=uncultured Thiodictyon sp. TaxID=1846217 RepID=UPI0025FDD355|nr:choice-of-anchor E domain-containing protein [uncultured Thiodictyon sp.]
MTASKLFKKLILGVLLVSAMTGSASADFIDSGVLFQNVNSYKSPTAAFTVTPFDTTLGTLNSVNMNVVLHISGSAQLFTFGEVSTITYNATNTLDAVSEMGRGTTVATLAGSEKVNNWNYDYDYAGGLWSPLNGTTGNSGITTITSNFGRFVGTTPFDIGLTLAGLATSTYQSVAPLDLNETPLPLDDLVFGYDGTAQMYYVYDYTPGAPVPEPSTLLLIGAGFGGLAIWRRRSKG